jgi:FkbM family methyltransferase
MPVMQLLARIKARLFSARARLTETIAPRRSPVNDKFGARIASLAKVRGETPDQVVARFGRKALRNCPRRFQESINFMRTTDIRSSGVKDGLAFVETGDGRLLYGEVSEGTNLRRFPFVADLLPSSITAEAFTLAHDVTLRYFREQLGGFALPIKPGDTVVEVGAFVGHLTMWFASKVGPTGKVIAIELMPENAAILRHNVEQNGLSGVVTVIEKGVWSSPGTMEVNVSDRQMSSLMNLKPGRPVPTTQLPVDSLDNILADVGTIDVMFVTVNGTELEALRGFSDGLARTKSMAVVSRYVPEANAKCREMLAAAGFSFLPAPHDDLILVSREPSATATVPGTARLFDEVTSAHFVDQIPAGARVLDCGAGDGAISIPLARKGCIVQAIDFQQERVDRLNKAAAGLSLTAVAGDFFTHPLEPVYDYVVARQFVPHFPNRWKDVLTRMASLCKPGGAVIFHVHSSDHADVSLRLADPEKRRRVQSGHTKGGAVSRVELDGFAKANGLVVERLSPFMFLHAKALVWRAGMEKGEREAFAAELDRHLSNPAVYDFARWFEMHVVGSMPAGFGSDFIALLRKPAAA